jgi:hypothetical protein
MRRIAGALIGVCAYASVASAGPGDACAVAAHLVQAMPLCRALPLRSKRKI